MKSFASDGLRREGASVLVRNVTRWFRGSARDLPWRRNLSPYRVWVSEVMLQQTVVAAVVPYYGKWMRAFPGVRALARAKEKDVLRMWEGLGYYSRARNLAKAARVIVASHGGRVPGNYADLTALPGIGDYTARAILNIAFGQPVMAFDANIRRVLARLLHVKKWNAAIEISISRGIEAAMQKGRSADVFEGLMELGEVICRARGPQCHRCPLSKSCVSYMLGEAESIPARKPKSLVRRRSRLAVFVAGPRIYVTPQDGSRNRAGSSFLRGMWGFPRYVVEVDDAVPCLIEKNARHVQVRLPARTHFYTRYREILEPMLVRLEKPFSTRGLPGRWVSREEIDQLPFPSIERKIVWDSLSLSR